MKTAIIKTDFWEEDRIFNLLPDARYFYICLLTNPKRNATPAFKCSDRQMNFFTGYNQGTIEICKKHLVEAGLITLVGEYYVINEQDFVKAHKGKLSHILYEKDFNSLPLEVQELLMSDSCVTHEYISNSININNSNNNKSENPSGDIDKDVQEVYKLFTTSYKRNPNQYKLSSARIAKIKARLKDAGKDMLLLAIEKSSKTPFYTGQNDRKWKADLDFITRSYEKVEQLSNLEVGGNLKYDKTPKKPQPKPVEQRKEIKVTPEEAEKNRIILDLVRSKKYTFSEMKMLKSKSLDELKAL